MRRTYGETRVPRVQIKEGSRQEYRFLVSIYCVLYYGKYPHVRFLVFNVIEEARRRPGRNIVYIYSDFTSKVRVRHKFWIINFV